MNFSFSSVYHPSALTIFFTFSLQPTPVILLKEGTDTSQGIPQLISNINACQVRNAARLSLIMCCCFFFLCGVCLTEYALNLS